jgi:hypothetical protein
MRHDAITRQLMAIKRAEREGEKLEHALARRGREFERHEREVVKAASCCRIPSRS